jgi:hypothetical protein
VLQLLCSGAPMLTAATASRRVDVRAGRRGLSYTSSQTAAHLVTKPVFRVWANVPTCQDAENEQRSLRSVDMRMAEIAASITASCSSLVAGLVKTAGAPESTVYLHRQLFASSPIALITT